MGYKITGGLKLIKIMQDAEKGLYKNGIVTSTRLMLFPMPDENILAEKRSDSSGLEKDFLTPPASK